MEHFSERLRELRQERNLSLSSLANLTGLSNSSLCRWENAQTDIKSEQLIILANFFGVTTDFLLGLED